MIDLLRDYLERRRSARAHLALARWLPHPLGHFYSPVCDADALAERGSQLWPDDPTLPGIQLDPQGQAMFLREVFPPLLADFDYPRTTTAAQSYSLENGQFSEADARTLFALLRHWHPKRMVEVGSGYSTLLAADINLRFLDATLQLTAIEPYPRDFLSGLGGLRDLRVERVQDTPLDVFRELDRGDVLFVDCSHVLKTDSDLTHLLTQVLPALEPGVRIHFHDIFLPDEYPRQWVVDENRSWNEQYAVQAMIAANPRYRVLFGTHFALTRLEEAATAAYGSLAGQAYAGSSFWIQVQ